MNTKKLLSNLKNDDKEIRVKALDEIALAQDVNAVKELEEVLLNDKESCVRRRAALALGRIESLESCEVLYKVLLTEKDSETRRNAAIALGRFSDERAILPLWGFYSAPRGENFFENIDRARVNLVLTEFSQAKGFSSIQEFVEWKKAKKDT